MSNRDVAPRLRALDERVKELEAALVVAIRELEASGLAFDHPTIVQLQAGLKVSNHIPDDGSMETPQAERGGYATEQQQ